MPRTHNSSNSNRIKGTKRQDAAKLHRISLDQCEVPGLLAVQPVRARPGRFGGVEEPAVHGEDVHDRVGALKATHDALLAHVLDAEAPYFAEDLTGRCRLCRLLYDDALHDHLSWAHDLCRVGCTSGRVLGLALGLLGVALAAVGPVALPPDLQMAAAMGSRY